MVNQHQAKFGDHRRFGSTDVMSLVVEEPHFLA